MPSLQDILGGSLVQAVGGIIDKFHLDPAKKAEIQTAVEANQEAFNEKEMELDGKLNDIAGQNIRTDSSSSDAFVRRARPFFLWIMSLALGFNIFVPLFSGGRVHPVPIDDGLYTLFGTGYLGFAYLRTKEKLSDKD